MRAPTYETLTGLLGFFDRAAADARNNDSIEVSITFSSPYVAALPGVDFVRGLIRQDAQNSWNRVQQAQSRLRQAHAWLAQSSQSVQALEKAQASWRTARELSRETLDSMTTIARRERNWDGAGAAGQQSVVQAQLQAQQGLVATATGLEGGCAAAQGVMSQVFSRVAMVLAGNAILAMGVAQRSPLVNYNLFALNSRMKAVAKAMETAATQYEAIRSGDGWRAHSNELRALFQRHAQLLEAVSEQSRRAMPV